MSSIRIRPVQSLRGNLLLPGDKSLSHRALIFGALAHGQTLVKHFLPSDDCQRTLKALEQLGIPIRKVQKSGQEYLEVSGRGISAFRPPKKDLYMGNSGTSMRLLLGVLANLPFKCRLEGDPSLSKRPMKRVTGPLRKMGASIRGRDDANFAPLVITGSSLKGKNFELPVSSAQVKSAILLAGIHASGVTRVTEPYPSRDHTERLLTYFGAKIRRQGLSVSVKGPQKLSARPVLIPADPSSAAFFTAGALLVPHSRVRIQSVLWNKTRIGFYRILKRMGASLEVIRLSRQGVEPTADIIIRSSPLKSCRVSRQEIPSAIDELPILMVLATQAKGTSVIIGAKELRIKETDRIKSMVGNLRIMGAELDVHKDNIYIHGPTPLRGEKVRSFKDHRTAMSMVIAGLVASGTTQVGDTDCIDISLPGFLGLLQSLVVKGPQPLKSLR